MKPPLLLFRLHEISKDAYWDGPSIGPLPPGTAAIAVSGGMADVWDRRRGKLSAPDERGDSYPLTPFLGHAPNGVLSRVIWALLGPLGRFYPIYRTGTTCAAKLPGFDRSMVPGRTFDVLASPKFRSLEAAQEADWAGDFLTCGSHAMGLGFREDVTKLERNLRRAECFPPFRLLRESVSESFDQRMEDTHPYLQANWQENGFDWILQNAPLVARPWGWEGEDVILLSGSISHDAMVWAIRRELGDELEIMEFDGEDLYGKWAFWPWPMSETKGDDPWTEVPNPASRVHGVIQEKS